MAFSSTLKLIGPFVKMEGNFLTVTVTLTLSARYWSSSSNMTSTIAVPPIIPVISPFAFTVTILEFVLK